MAKHFSIYGKYQYVPLALSKSFVYPMNMVRLIDLLGLPARYTPYAPALGIYHSTIAKR